MYYCLSSLLRKVQSPSVSILRLKSNKNILTLKERGIIEDIFPNTEIGTIKNLLIKKPQCVYAGFDPTANSLHVGSLLILVNLLHWQRGGHDVIALIGGATGKIGDPSGKNKDRPQLEDAFRDKNLQGISKNIETVFENHSKYLWDQKEELKPLRILNNEEWYSQINSIDFVSTIGRNFRIGTMLLKQSVQTRLNSDVGISFTEFTYQIFQAYDWLYLYNKYNCRFQIGGSDQMGNIWSGHELISRTLKKDAYGITIPLITNKDGNKVGKTEGNAIWLDEQKTSPYKLYQYFLRTDDQDVEKMLYYFTFLPAGEIRNVMRLQGLNPEKRIAQEKLAEQVTILVHGTEGLERAKKTTEVLFSKSSDALVTLTTAEITQVFEEASHVSLILEPGITILDLAMKAKCFNREVDAIRIIDAGGFFVNHQRVTNYKEVLSQAAHILPNNVTLIRVGKKNYYVVKWV